MTATVHLTDAQLAQFTACGLIVVDGEPGDWCGETCPGNSRICERVPGHDGRHEATLHGVIGTSRAALLFWTDGYPVHDECGVPDRALVAPELWRKLTDPCPTCAGSGVTHWDTSDDCDHACPECDRGNQVVTLMAACQTCAGDPYACWTCKNKGVVTLGRFTIRLLPVYAHPPGFGSPKEPCIYEFGICLWLWRGENDYEAIQLNPTPQPGQWVVQFEAVAALTDNGAPVRPVDPGTGSL